MTPQYHTFEAFGYVVKSTTYDDYTKFVVFSIDGYLYDENFEPTKPVFDETRPFLHGSVNSRHYSDWYFDEQDHDGIRGCNRGDLLNIGQIMAACWDIAAQSCVNLMEA